MTVASGWRVALSVMGGVFLLSAVVQLNDPDPVAWTAVYAAAALVCVAAALGRRVPWHAGALAAVSAVWAVSIGVGMDTGVTASEVFASLTMQTKEVEEAREIGGLAIVVAWMLVVAVLGRGADEKLSPTRPT